MSTKEYFMLIILCFPILIAVAGFSFVIYDCCNLYKIYKEQTKKEEMSNLFINISEVDDNG